MPELPLLPARRATIRRSAAHLHDRMRVYDDPFAVFAGASSQLDLTIARKVFGEDAALFVSLLARLVGDFSEFALPVSVKDYDAAALTHLKARLHKLTGGAGLIGATSLHRLARAAEAALAAGQAPDRVESLLRQLTAAFTALVEELAPLI